jgi:VCBS repeat-containing protein
MATELIFGTENGDSLFAASAKNTATAAIPRGPLEGALPRPFDAAQVLIPEGQTVVHVAVTPGEVVELPFGPEAHFLAELGNGNLAIKVGDVVVILEGYAALANPPVIEAADGTVLDIATILAATDPNIDIQTAAGPGGQGGSGADNTGAIFQQLGGEGGLGGFTGVGGQGDSGGPNGFDGTPENSLLLLPQSTETPHPNSPPVAPDVTAFTDEDTGIFDQLAATDADGNSLTYALVGAAPTGVTFTPDGKWIFDPAGHFDGLQAGEQTTVSFQYDATDGFDRSNTATVTIAVDGVNDKASFTGDTQLEIVENTTTPVSGAVVVHDLDHDQAAVATTGDFAGQYGTFSVHADGSWSYTLDNANPSIDSLTAEMFTTDTLTIKSIEGTEQTLTVKIDGANDPATITGDLTGDVTEDTAITTTGQIVINDPDQGQSTVTPTTYFGQYGNLTIDADGKWTYALDNNDPFINRLRDSNDTFTDTFPTTSSDGTAGQNLVITIHGHDDAPVLTSLMNPVERSEDDPETIIPVEQSSQIDDPDSQSYTYALVGAVPAGMTMDPDGTVHFDPTGHYDYLTARQVANFVVSYKVTDDGGADSNTATFNFTVVGANDPAKITGDFTGDVTEDSGVKATGQIFVDDPDDGESAIPGHTYVGTYGSLVLGTDGKWAYTLDDANLAVDKLTAKDSLTDTITVSSQDGTASQDIVITIHGHNDAPVANADIVLTNAGLAQFEIPIAALLANDRDPEGDALQQTDWRYDTGPNGDLSHFTVLSTGNLQIEDNSPLGAQFRYFASDGHTTSNSANVKIFNQDGGDLTGTAAHEILIGSAANAKIDGGGGNDLIFGGDGDETFIYHDGDVVRGGRDSSFPDSFDIRGDVLAINHDVDFTKLDLSRFSSIETLSLMEAGAGAGTAQSLTLDASDVMTLSSHSIKFGNGDPAIRIDLEAVDQLYLSIAKNGDGWSQFTVGKDLVVYAHETTAGDSNTADAFVVIHTPFSGNVGPPPANVHLDQSAP